MKKAEAEEKACPYMLSADRRRIRINCMTVHCMAWSWRETQRLKADAPSNLYFPSNLEEIPVDERDGYCRLVRR
jgi:hypothetical protein